MDYGTGQLGLEWMIRDWLHMYQTLAAAQQPTSICSLFLQVESIQHNLSAEGLQVYLLHYGHTFLAKLQRNVQVN